MITRKRGRPGELWENEPGEQKAESNRIRSAYRNFCRVFTASPPMMPEEPGSLST
jgi:hypothetical protein